MKSLKYTLVNCVVIMLVCSCSPEQMSFQLNEFNQRASELGTNIKLKTSSFFDGFKKKHTFTHQTMPKPTTFEALADWKADLHSGGLRAFLLSCKKIEQLSPDAPIEPKNIGGKASDWQPLCQKARQLDDGDDITAEAFFEHNFTPYKVEEEAFFTGYYEIFIYGSKKRHGPYQYPIYGTPKDLVTVNQPSENSSGTVPLTGRIVDNVLQPYYTRKQISEGILANKKLEIAWVDDQVRLFFMHVQGVGTLLLDDGDTMRVGFAAKNGHPYTAIGKVLKDKGELNADSVTAPSIMKWLYDHPDQAQDIMNNNASYIFFRKTLSSGPLGAQGVPITGERSIAIDHDYIPFGMPVWVETAIPYPGGPKPYHRLVLAQDSGSAIKGPARVDIFFGAGQDAEWKAGNLKGKGNIYLLIPKTINVN
ncbi:MAG: murein transglycosylase A [Alphaproteobacteria bacterium]|nr:murein transglycosylase A [Alphaproteobacteria bacterium]